MSVEINCIQKLLVEWNKIQKKEEKICGIFAHQFGLELVLFYGVGIGALDIGIFMRLF